MRSENEIKIKKSAAFLRKLSDLHHSLMEVDYKKPDDEWFSFDLDATIEELRKEFESFDESNQTYIKGNFPHIDEYINPAFVWNMIYEMIDCGSDADDELTIKATQYWIARELHDICVFKVFGLSYIRD